MRRSKTPHSTHSGLFISSFHALMSCLNGGIGNDTSDSRFSHPSSEGSTRPEIHFMSFSSLPSPPFARSFSFFPPLSPLKEHQFYRPLLSDSDGVMFNFYESDFCQRSMFRFLKISSGTKKNITINERRSFEDLLLL